MKKIYLQMDRFSKTFWIFILTIFCISLTITSTILQDVLSLMPCPYCIFQRTLYLIIGIFSLLLLSFDKVLKIKIKAISKTILSIIFILSLVGFIAAIYQSAMQLFPDLVPECSFSEPGLVEKLVDTLGELHYWFLATGLCSSKEWTLFGLSMANWSVLCFLFVAFISSYLLFFRNRNIKFLRDF